MRRVLLQSILWVCRSECKQEKNIYIFNYHFSQQEVLGDNYGWYITIHCKYAVISPWFLLAATCLSAPARLQFTLLFTLASHPQSSCCWLLSVNRFALHSWVIFSCLAFLFSVLLYVRKAGRIAWNTSIPDVTTTTTTTITITIDHDYGWEGFNYIGSLLSLSTAGRLWTREQSNL